jgi:hypothetical protein
VKVGVQSNLSTSGAFGDKSKGTCPLSQEKRSYKGMTIRVVPRDIALVSVLFRGGSFLIAFVRVSTDHVDIGGIRTLAEHTLK